MPEREFELYLSLLSRFLRLRPEQRAEIADELRDHLEERLDELTREGLSREEAVVRALDEFGDAASLASHFTRITRQRKRRLIMRLTLGSTIAVTLAVLVGLAIWPAGPANGPQQANAQQNAPPQKEVVDKEDELPGVPVSRDRREAAVQEKLSKRLSKVEFEDTPLSDVLTTIGDQIGVDILFNRRALEDAAILPSEMRVSLVLKHTDISARTALELLLEGEDLAYRIRDGFIYVETRDAIAEVMEIQVYNVRDLLVEAESRNERGRAAAGRGFFSVSSATGDDSHKSRPVQLAQMDAGGGGMGMGPWPQVPEIALTPSGALIDVIQQTTSGPWFAEEGEGGTISAFDGLLVIRQTQAIHREVEQLLDMMRAAMKEQPRAKKPAKRQPPVPPKVRRSRGAHADEDDAAGPEGSEKFDIRRKQPREPDEAPESLPPVRP